MTEASTPGVELAPDKLSAQNTVVEAGVVSTEDVGPVSSDSIITVDADINNLQSVSEVTLPSDVIHAEEQRVNLYSLVQ